jgi:nitrate reductase gamma subunit
MEHLVELFKGPLFALTFGIMVLGLLRLFLIQIYTIVTGKGRRLFNAPWRKIIRETLSWIIPFRHFIKGTVLFSLASFVFHIGVILVPVFLVDHVVLWEEFLDVNLPAISHGVADALTLTTIACLCTLLGCRVFVRRHRCVSRPIDYGLIVCIIMPFATGFLLAHPSINPFRWDVLMLIHLVSAESLFLLVPFTKLAHVVLFMFDRISEIHWQLRPGAGDRVAEALFGREARV